MKKNKLFYVLLVLLVVAMFITACGGKQTSGDDKTGGSTDNKTQEPSSGNNDDQTDEKELEHYTFTHYYNYDWWGLKEWGKDEVSKYFGEKFNVTVEFAKPDADPKARLTTMIQSGELPDSIMMDRGTDNIELARLGLLQPLEQFMEKNTNLQDNLLPQTIDLLKIDGKLYGIPNWPRKAASGGNDIWMYNKRVYEDAGSPKLETLEDMYNFALKVKNEVKATREGLSVYPVLFKSGNDGYNLARAFYRSFGGVLNGWYGVVDGKYQLVFRDPVFKKATMELNRWYREGLIDSTQFTDSGDQILEKVTNGRVGLLWEDFSTDDTTKFRKILMQNFPDDSYEIVSPYPYPPAEGLTPDDIYADFQSTLGWNVTCITTSAKNPQRIFDLFSYYLTPEAALIQMYGPPGHMWDELDENGLPKLKKPESQWTPEEVNALGAWFWMEPGHSDNVDSMKFAVNEALPEDQRSWVVSNQANITTPIMWLTDEFVGIGDDIDPQSNEAYVRTLVEDYIKANYPQVIMASSAAEAERLYDDIVKFADDNGFKAVEDIYDARYQLNVKNFGGTGLTKGIYAK